MDMNMFKGCQSHFSAPFLFLLLYWWHCMFQERIAHLYSCQGSRWRGQNGFSDCRCTGCQRYAGSGPYFIIYFLFKTAVTSPVNYWRSLHFW